MKGTHNPGSPQLIPDTPSSLSLENTGGTKETNGAQPTMANICAACKQLITDRYLLNAVDLLWHQDCLKCFCCSTRLIDVGSTLFVKRNLILCKDDYLRICSGGLTGKCSACSETIPANTLVMRVRDRVYHQHCFCCSICSHRLYSGDKFYWCDDGQILCEYDYTEKQVFAKLEPGSNTLSHIAHQVDSLVPDVSSGQSTNYGDQTGPLVESTLPEHVSIMT